MQMADQNAETPAPVGLDTPVDQATLDRLGDLQEKRFQLGNTMIDLELEKVKVMALARQIDGEVHKLFEVELIKRGLPPQAVVEIDPTTRMMRVLSQPMPPQAPPAAPVA
jgi:hypothetical protein